MISYLERRGSCLKPIPDLPHHQNWILRRYDIARALHGLQNAQPNHALLLRLFEDELEELSEFSEKLGDEDYVLATAENETSDVPVRLSEITKSDQQKLQQFLEALGGNA